MSQHLAGPSSPVLRVDLRVATGMVGQLNAPEVQRFGSTKQTRGFIAAENEQLAGTRGGHTWYDDVRVHQRLPGEAACAA